jgi:hypothetical protein
MQGRSGKRAVVTMTVGLLAALGALTAGARTAGADTSTVVGQWRFDEGGGQVAVDDGPFGLDGRLGVSDDADSRDPERIAGVSGGALRFDGRAFVRLPVASELAPPTLTIEAVVRAPSSPGHFRYVVARGAQGCIAGSYGLYTGADGGLAFYVFDGTNYRISAAIGPQQVWNGAWHHAAGVFDGSALRFFVDGHPVGDPIWAPSIIAYALTSSDTFFGTYQGTCALPLRGDVDLVRLWRGALSPDFIGTLADQALRPPPATIAPPVTVTPPTATQEESQGDAPASRSTLPPVAPGLSLPATLAPTSRAPTTPTAGAPRRACVVKSSTKRLRAGTRTKLTVQVALRGKPLKSVKVTATDTHSRRRLATAKTAHDGRARLHVKPTRRGKVKLAVPSRTDCSTTALTVLSARR